MTTLLTTFRRPQVWATCVFVFIVDVVMGMLLPSFSLYAIRLGAPLTLIGFLGTTIGLGRILSSLPMGLASDARGRRSILVLGATLLAGTSFMHTVVVAPRMLIPLRALIGIGMTATFPIGAAHLGDVVPPEQRSLAIGLYYASMGLGFAIGPVLAGAIASASGYRTSYRLAAVLALAAGAIAVTGLTGQASQLNDDVEDLTPGDSSRVPLVERLSKLTHRPDVLASGIANLLVAGGFHGAIVGFLPLRASSLGISDQTFGLLFSIRTVVSTAARLPAGYLNSKFSGRRVILAALLTLGATHLALPYADSSPSLLACMVLEGIAYGVFVTSGQDFVIARSSNQDRGATVGLYSMLGSMGSMIAPYALGLAASSWGLSAVFSLSGAMLSAGAPLVTILSKGRSVANPSTH